MCWEGVKGIAVAENMRKWRTVVDMVSDVPRIFFFGGGGVQQIRLWTEDRENGSWRR
jgi:hypothetical protein